MGSLHEGPRDEAGPLQAPGPVHVKLWCACWCLIVVLGRPKGCIGTLLAGFTRPPYSGSIGMNQEQHEELQPAHQFQLCSSSLEEELRGGGGAL